MNSLGTFLGVWAHPDDEAYLTAGLMAQSVRDGARVVCVTATKGEGGSWDEVRWPSETMGEVRAAELLRSLEVLGVKEHHWLGYIDGACADVPPDEGISRVRTFIEDVRPDSVFTFGPDGMTDHPDHKAVCAWTTAAFAAAAKAGAKLYYATTTPEWAEKFTARLNKFNVFPPGFPVVTNPGDLAIEFDLPPDVLQLKLEAISRHVSQVEYMHRYFGDDFFLEAYRKELFRLAAER